MKLTIIGSSGSMCGPDSPASCYLLQAPHAGRTYSAVFDMGPGGNGGLLKYLDPVELDFIGISHCHADHMVDLIGHQVYRKWHPEGHLPRTRLWGPSNLTQRMLGVSGDTDVSDYSAEFELGQWQVGQTIEAGPFRITAFRAEHPVEAYSLRVEGPSVDPARASAVFTYTGDTDRCEGVLAAAAGADLLLSEAAFLERHGIGPGVHLTGKRAGELATDAAAKHLVLTHIQPWTDKQETAGEARATYAGPISVALPGDTFEF
ncbi:MBL fold metallo-hydrolase [Buchananella felis]|uniref:MBL fold metallo-hydrolase n=1 Tax=Buchananella felis TaxID=3231492 RepID=UPI003528406B